MHKKLSVSQKKVIDERILTLMATDQKILREYVAKLI